MSKEMKIYEQGAEEYPKPGIFLGNLVMIFWIALGMIGCWFLYPLAVWIYFAFAVIMIGFVLRKLLCTNCYYYGKWCCLGWGKLAALFFEEGNIENFNQSVGQKLAPATYGLLSLIPLILIAVSLFQEFTIFKIAVLILLLSISFYSGTVSRKKTCAVCKMRLVCAGCAVK